MFQRTVSEHDLATLKAARDEAEARYRQALTDLDRAIHAVEDYPHPPPGPDDTQITPLNRLWEVAPPVNGAPSGGWRTRLQRIFTRPLAPYFARQQAFNSAAVDHANRNLVVMRETQKAIASVIALVQYHFQSVQLHTMAYLQHLTPYIDANDREVLGLMRRINEDVAERVTKLENLPGVINTVSDELLKQSESMKARERRFEARVSALRVANEDALIETRTALSALQHTSSALRRQMEQVLQAPSGTRIRPVTKEPAEAQSPAESRAESLSASASFDAQKYVGFEDLFRGSQEEIRSRLADYVPDFEGASDVLDVGCGRGEFLDLLKEHGISAKGLDINHEMVELCRARGLDAVEADALAYLDSLPDGSLGGIFAAQVIEHLRPDYLLRFLDAAHRKLKPGARIALETINPACWFAFFQSYIRDITHERALHPDTMRYLVVASGFRDVELRYRVPYPEHEKLQLLPRPNSSGSAEADAQQELVDTFNENVEKINQLLFTFLDYAVIGRR
jgi:SAM-dependent methyltransferase